MHLATLHLIDLQKRTLQQLDTSGVFHLDTGLIMITLPNAGKRFTSMQVISRDHNPQQRAGRTATPPRVGESDR
jgi:hypothetical protein